jgi:DNA mismatch repair protein MutS
MNAPIGAIIESRYFLTELEEEKMLRVEPISLLWPRGEPAPDATHWLAAAAADLGLEGIGKALNFDGKHERSMRTVILTPCGDAETIRYRQEIIDDLLTIPELLGHFRDLLPLLSDLAYYGSLSEGEGLPFEKTLGRIGELELYIQIVKTLSTFLNTIEPQLHSAGLRALHAMLQQRIKDPIFDHMQRELPNITVNLRKLSSITIGINLDHNLKPIGATLVSINTEPFRGSSFFKKLFGDRPEFQGMSQLHTVPMQTVDTLDGRMISTQKRGDPMLFPLFKDLDHIINDTVRPAAAALREFLQVSTQFLAALEPEIVFYLGAARLVNDLMACGLPMCRAETAEAEARTCIIRDCYNLNLALRSMERQPKTNLAAEIVGNDVQFDDNGRIFIITGPNQGGKTTYIQAIALAQVLFQAGLYVPGTSACISPVDGIYTHFPVEEKPSAEAGRFGEEAQRLGEIFAQATRYSLILMNESLASTASGESLYLAQDIVRCLRLLGVRAAYTTHMHELAAQVDELNDSTPGDSRVISLVAVAESQPTMLSSDSVKRTYKIVASPPMGHSYAHELAVRYGISFEKIVETLTARQVIKDRLGAVES